jgi:DUF971 family protein
VALSLSRAKGGEKFINKGFSDNHGNQQKPKTRGGVRPPKKNCFFTKRVGARETRGNNKQRASAGAGDKKSKSGLNMLAATTTQKDDVDVRIRTLVEILSKRSMVEYSVHKRFAKEHFMPVHDEYYLRYIATQRKWIREIAYSQNYIYVKINVTDRDYNSKYYVIGVDTESNKLFVNRVNYASIEEYMIKLEEISENIAVIRVKESFFKERVFEYNIDITDDEYVVDIGPYEFMTYRVQGDLQVRVSKYPNDFDVLGAIDRQVMELRAYLVADKIAAILSDYGISYNVRRGNGGHYEIIIPGGTNSSRWSKYSRRNRLRIVKILSQYFTIESPNNVSDYGNATIVRMRDGDAELAVEIISRTASGEWVGDIIIRARAELSYERRRALIDDVIKQLDTLQPVAIERHVGNHHIKLKNVVPISVAYTPPVKTLVLDPLTLYIVVPNTYIVFRDSVIELSHREHGIRKIKFADKYVVRITHNDVHVHDVAQRNRVILSRIEPYRL